MNSKTVIILGCGPAGLLAAHAVRLSGHEPLIFSKKVKSNIGGAQYLHQRIPGIRQQDHQMTTIKVGDRNEYARKVYGTTEAPVSWDHYPDGVTDIYNMREIYDQLWETFESEIGELPITAHWVQQMRMHPIVCSIPRVALCEDPHHEFLSQKVYIDYRETGGDGNLVLYNGRTEEPWYRMSRLFGWESWEYSESTAKANATVNKPISTTCDCFDGDGVQFVGRYGRWDKSQLIHDAFLDTMTFMEYGHAM